MARSTKKTICDYCKKTTYKETFDFKRTNHNFCSRLCRNYYFSTKKEYNCSFCEKKIIKNNAQLRKSSSGRLFCDSSCSAQYFNRIRIKSRRSKIEIKLFKSLTQKYNNLVFLPNDKTMLDGLEVDIAIPELKLAIEWNGIVHFKPIYGEEKLKNIQEKDRNKLKIASNKNVNLIVIPDLVSNDAIFQRAFKDICNIIDSLI